MRLQGLQQTPNRVMRCRSPSGHQQCGTAEFVRAFDTWTERPILGHGAPTQDSAAPEPRNRLGSLSSGSCVSLHVSRREQLVQIGGSCRDGLPR